MTDYKDTLNLPKTAFAMKANLAQREPARLQQWQDNKLYQQIREARKGADSFMFHDGPPYANGDIHLGHALNKTLKDIIVKAKSLSGYDAPFVPGWDCHGLPIELNVEKKKGKPGHKISAKDFRQACRDYAATQVDKQKSQFQRLGVMADWDNPYLTMQYEYEASVVRMLTTLLKAGHIKRGVKPVYWCIDCGSALAEAEVEYRDKKSNAIDVAFTLLDQAKVQQAFAVDALDGDVIMPIWTTTPWTLPANQAVTLGAEIDYVLLQAKRDGNLQYFIVAEALKDKIIERYALHHSKVLATTFGKALEGLLLQHPFYDKQVPVCLGEHVTTDDGTGCVHTAPAHGIEDYEVGLQYDLDIGQPVLGSGCYADNIEIFAGKFVRKVDDDIIALLQEKGNLLAHSVFEHSYPHCWRHKTPLIYRATPQWFVAMDENGLRSQSLAAIETVNWFPLTGKNRMTAMLEGRPDWCISRQRAWGAPIPFITHKQTGEMHPDIFTLLEKVAQLVEANGIEGWFECSLEDLIGDEADDYEKSQHVLDVWFDAGSSHFAVLDQREGLHSPADVILEGSDQFRGWFQSLLLTSLCSKEQAPYHDVITHGFTLDSQGRKMSKSLGNVISPDKIIKTLGADILRLWVASTDYQQDMSLSDEILKRTSEAYRRLRNTARFLLSNLDGFAVESDLQPLDSLVALDRWVVARALQVQEQIVAAYDSYQFHVVYQLLYRFCIVDLGNFYLDIIKDRQYTAKAKCHARLSAQTAMYHVLQAFVRWLSPICSFTADEIWEHIPGDKPANVFVATWYDQLQPLDDNAQMNDAYWQNIVAVRDEVNKVIEAKRNAGDIGGALEAEVTLYADGELLQQLQQLKDELRFVLITSEAQAKSLADASAEAVAVMDAQLKIDIIKTDKQKCERCWQRRADVGHNAVYSGVCGRCVINIEGNGEERHYA